MVIRPHGLKWHESIRDWHQKGLKTEGIASSVNMLYLLSDFLGFPWERYALTPNGGLGVVSSPNPQIPAPTPILYSFTHKGNL